MRCPVLTLPGNRKWGVGSKLALALPGDYPLLFPLAVLEGVAAMAWAVSASGVPPTMAKCLQFFTVVSKFVAITAGFICNTFKHMSAPVSCALANIDGFTNANGLVLLIFNNPGLRTMVGLNVINYKCALVPSELVSVVRLIAVIPVSSEPLLQRVSSLLVPGPRCDPTTRLCPLDHS